MQQIIALGGGGFSMEPDNPALDRYILDQAGVAAPKVCFLPQASGEAMDYIIRFYKAFTSLGAVPSHLSLFQPHTADIADYLLSQHVIYVGGGNTRSMLALWREWGLDRILRTACEQGVVLAGLSAGAICWFAHGTTDSIPGRISVLSGLGLLPGSCTPHYDSQEKRRPALHEFVTSGAILPGYAFDDSAGGHFIDGHLHAVVTSRPEANGYRVERGESGVRETALEKRFLG